MIPRGEEFGNAALRVPQFNENVPRGAFGDGIARTVQGIASDLARTNHAEDEQAKRERVIADRAAAANGLELGRVRLAEAADVLDEDVRLGRVGKDEAEREWQERSAELVNAAAREVSGPLSVSVQGVLNIDREKLSGRVRKAVSVRNMEDTRASLTGLLEAAERNALADRGAAVNKAAESLQTLGPFAGLGPDDQARLLSQFRERAAFNAGSAVVRGARDDMKALDGAMDRLHSDEFADLAPERLGQLETQILGRKQYLQSQEQTRIARAEAAAARRDREAESSFKAAQAVIDGGAALDPAYLEAVTARTAGTPYAPALKQLVQQSGERAGFAQQSPQEQQATILALRAQANASGSTPVLEQRIATFERLASEAEKQLRDDPLVYGVNRRLIDAVRPIQFSAIDQLVPQLQERAEQARTVSARVKLPVSPLLKSEAETAADMLAILPLEQRARAVRQIAQSVDTSMGQALAAQVSEKDQALGLAMFAAVNAGGAPRNVTALVLRGADAEKAGRLKGKNDGGAAARDHASIASELAAVPWSTTKARDAAVKATQLVYDGLRDERGGSASVREAITLATGGLTEWAGTKVPMPPGMDERRFRRTLERLDPQRVALQAGGPEVMVGGQALPVEQLVRNMGAVRLVPAGPGVYALESGGQMVMTGQGRVLRLNVGALGD
ncbi:hypothetical protein [Methylibium petroleiphilum]|uniref:hypothetical protein n=1 Tax=Methylibium petroleiphilum TaxID=105560 RepID=UPI003D2CA4A9